MEIEDELVLLVLVDDEDRIGRGIGLTSWGKGARFFSKRLALKSAWLRC